MNAAAAGRWWSVALRGIAAVAFGAIALTWPGVTLGALVLLFGAFVLVDGVAIIVDLATGRGRHRGSRGLLLVQALVSVAAGIVTFVWPGITAIALTFVIAAWALITGSLELGAVVRLRRTIRNHWLLAVDGVLAVLLAVVLLSNPAAGALGLVWVIGWFAVISGVVLVVHAFRIRRAQGSVGPAHTAPSPI